MEFNLMSTDMVYPNINIVFDDSLYAVSDDTVFVCSVGQRFNSNITFPSYAESIRIGGQPYNFNCPINIPPNVKSVGNLFALCNNYNNPTVLNSGITNCMNMFARAYKYNSDVTISEGVTSLYRLFSFDLPSNSIFNRPVTIPNSVVNCREMFFNCTSFNQPINIPGNAIDYSNMFYMASSFNSDVNIAKSNNQVVTNAYGMFQQCTMFNRPVNIPEKTVISYMLYGCTNYNQPINIPNGQSEIVRLLSGCNNFNQPVTIPNSISDMSYCFIGCTRLNSPITFEDNMNNTICTRTFEGCYSLNQNIVLKNGVKRTDVFLCNCTTFNASVVIPPTVNNTYQMFWNVNSCEYNLANGRFNTTPSYNALRAPIYFYANSIIVGQAAQMFSGCNTLSELYITGVTNNFQLNMFMRNNGINRCNIYTDDASLEFLRTTPMLVNGGKPSWTANASNGCIYNTTMNIYIYNNWDGTIPSL